jgi:hypothetical protein
VTDSGDFGFEGGGTLREKLIEGSCRTGCTVVQRELNSPEVPRAPNEWRYRSIAPLSAQISVKEMSV